MIAILKKVLCMHLKMVMSVSYTHLAVLVASLLFQQEKLTGRKIVGCLIGFAGVVIVNLGGSMDMGFRLTGEGFIFLSTVALSLIHILY